MLVKPSYEHVSKCFIIFQSILKKRQTEGQTEGQTERPMDRQTDGQYLPFNPL